MLALCNSKLMCFSKAKYNVQYVRTHPAFLTAPVQLKEAAVVPDLGAL